MIAASWKAAQETWQRRPASHWLAATKEKPKAKVASFNGRGRDKLLNDALFVRLVHGRLVIVAGVDG